MAGGWRLKWGGGEVTKWNEMEQNGTMWNRMEENGTKGATLVCDLRKLYPPPSNKE